MPTPGLYILVIHYTNGSKSELGFSQYSAVRDTYQHGISYAGVRRVEVAMHNGGLRAIWDASWDKLSQAAGLEQQSRRPQGKSGAVPQRKSGAVIPSKD